MQVKKALSADPQLSGVRIARVYFEGGGRSVNLEIFEAMQHWLFTALRGIAVADGATKSLVRDLLQETGQPAAEQPEPIGHVALQVRRRTTVEAVHAALAEARETGALTLPYCGGLSYNPGDASINTKLISRDRVGGANRNFASIVEVISYGHEGATQ